MAILSDPHSNSDEFNSELNINSIFSGNGIENTLSKEQFLIQALNNNTVFAYCILGKNMEILWANAVAHKQAEKVFGKEISKGDSILKYTSPSHHEKLRETIKEVLNGVSTVYDRQIKLPDGSEVWTTIEIQPLYDKNRNIVALSYSAIDNTERKLSQDKAEEAQQTLSVLFDSLAQTYVLFDLNRRVSWFNLKAHEESLELFSHPLSVGLSCSDILPAPLLSQMEEYFNRVYKGETITYERNYSNHPRVWKQIVLGPVKDKDRNVVGLYLTSKDITDIKIALQSSLSNEYKMRAIFDTSRDAHTLFSEDYKLIWANKEAKRSSPRIFGVDMMLGDDIDKYVAPQYRESFDRYFTQAKSGTPVNYERRYSYPGKKDVWLSITIASIQYSEDKSRKGISFTIKDITDQKEYEERLTQVNKELVDQNQQLNQFSYIVSHNLRGPVASLMGLTNILQKDLGDKVQSEIIEGFKITVQRFDEIINDLTKILSQTNEADKSKSIISLEEEFAKVMDLQRGIIDQINAKINIEFSAPKITGVKSFVHSIFLNLLSNAIKYRAEERQLKISVKSSIHNDKVLIEFNDNGMGIDMERYHDKLFSFYKRFHTHIDGKGLGLYLVKTQAELMGGKVDVKSKVGEGTTFYIYLPKG